jgi:uridylate kinase
VHVIVGGGKIARDYIKAQRDSAKGMDDIIFILVY